MRCQAAAAALSGIARAVVDATPKRFTTVLATRPCARQTTITKCLSEDTSGEKQKIKAKTHRGEKQKIKFFLQGRT
jgi:hypothetical protein